MNWPVQTIRRQFAGLQRKQDDKSVALFDGPAGSQIPDCVVDAVSEYLRSTNCNRGAAFATAKESDDILNRAHEAMADFVGADDPDCIVFGANMTSLTFQLSRALSRTWQAGDEILVTRLDHDANVTPWVLAARDRGAIVRHVELHPEDWTLNLDDFRGKLSDKTRLVAFGYASNATGTVNPVQKMTELAHQAGALVFIDAVHFAPHGRIRVDQIGCDFLACSAYKFFGPHVGILWGRRQLLEEVRPYKLRPSPESLPGRWMTGTQCHEGIAGTAAAVEYLCSLDESLPSTSFASGPPKNGNTATSDQSRTAKLDHVFAQITAYEQSLSNALLRGLQGINGIRVWGISDLQKLGQRVPTISFTLDGRTPRETAEWLAARGVYVWNGNHYAVPFTETAGLEPGGTLRVGALHYNTLEEIDRLITELHGMQD